MPFRQYVRRSIAAGLDETYRFETWRDAAPGRGYYDVHVSVIEQHETSVPLLRRTLAPPGRLILESGCGTGRWMAYFERLGHRTVGLDDSLGPLAVAHAHDPALRLVRGDARRAPFADATFDVVFSAYVAEHFDDGPLEFFREARRLLKPGGQLLVVVPYASLFRRLVTHPTLQAYYAWAQLRGVALAFNEHRFSRRELRALLAQAGFVVEQVEPDDYRYPWAKGLSVDLGPLVRPRGAAPGGWELNAFGRGLARALGVLPAWAWCSGVFCVARK
jgi:SAM-dependent methyltransferase